MSNETRLLALFEEANPVPDERALDQADIEPTAYLEAIRERSSEVTKLEERIEEGRTRSRNWILVGAAAVLVIVLGFAIYLLTQSNEEPPVVTEPPPTTAPIDPGAALDVQIELELVENQPEGTQATGVFRATGAFVDDGAFCERGVYTETFYQQGATASNESFGMSFDCSAPVGTLVVDVESVGSESAGIWTAENTWTVSDSSGSLGGIGGSGTGTSECNGQLCSLIFDGQLEPASDGSTEGAGAAQSAPVLSTSITSAGEYRSPDTFASPFSITLPEGWTAKVVQDERIHLAPANQENRVLKLEWVPMPTQELIDLFAAEEASTVSEPEQTTIAGLDASYVRMTTTEPVLTLVPGWVYDAYFIDVDGTEMLIDIEAMEAVHDQFINEVMPVIESIVWANQG